MDRLVYIAGSGHCGSTLLETLLSNSPDFCILGEAQKFWDYYSREWTCPCGSRYPDCPFWRAIIREVAEHRGGEVASLDLETAFEKTQIGSVRSTIQSLMLAANWWRLYRATRCALFARHADVTENNLDLFEAAAKTTGRTLIVDSSKNARRLGILLSELRERMFVIHLVRDGRAVAASEVRRTDATMSSATRSWQSINSKIDWLLRTVPKESRMRVRYEDLCRDPNGTLHRITQMLGAEEVTDTELRKKGLHSVGGNQMKARVDETKIVLDEAWIQALSSPRIAEFDRLAGRLNRHYGYN